MPSPFDLLFDPVSLVVFAVFLGVVAWEAIAPARDLPAMPYSRTKGVAMFFAYFFVSSYLPMLFADALAGHRIVDLTSWPRIAGALVGLVVYEALAYVYHRSLHRSSFLFRTVHQIHHSPERLDSWSAYWFGPLDMVGWTVVYTFALVYFVGLSGESVALVAYVTTFLSTFQHANIRTPRWLGYLVQRPESHSHHHARGVHEGNYSDLPIFDLIFGTFRNPADFAEATGYYDGASSRLGEMLVLRDVSTDDTGRVDRHASPMLSS